MNAAMTRMRLGWLLEHLEPMQAISRSKTGQFPLTTLDGDVLINAWPRDVRAFLGEQRGRFTHGHTRVADDGTVTTFDGDASRRVKWLYSSAEFGVLVDRISTAIYGRLNFRIDATMTCDTCGATAHLYEPLPCGHVDYSSCPPRDGTVTLYDLPGGTSKTVIMVGDGGVGAHTVAFIPGAKLPSWWLLMFVDGMVKHDAAIMARPAAKCRCGNTASPADGCCKHCRPSDRKP